MRDSNELCRRQEAKHRAGFKEIEIVQSNYGYSVRYASGLDNWGLLRPARGQADPSLEAARTFCKAWVLEDPVHRSYFDRF